MRDFLCVFVLMMIMTHAVNTSAESPATPSIPVKLGIMSTPALSGTCSPDNVYVDYLRQGKFVTRADLGEEVLLKQGMYQARVMQGERVVYMSPDKLVSPGTPQHLEVSWGGLDVVASNAFGQRIRQPLRLNTPDDQTSFTWTTSKKQPPTCWVLPAGRVRLASTQRTDTRGVDVWVPAGKVLSYRLTLKRQAIQSVEFAQQATPVEQTPAYAPFSWTVAGHAAFDQNRNRAGVDNIQSLSLGVRTALNASWMLSPRHTLSSVVRFEHARASIISSYGDEIFQLRKKRDELRLGLEYQWTMSPWLGLYAKGLGKAPAFGTYFEPDEDVRVLLRDDQGRFGVVPVSKGTSLRLWWPFTPLYTQQEVGARVSVAQTHNATVFVDAGLAARQALYRGGLILTQREGPTITALRLSDTSFIGPHASLTMDLNVTEVLHVQASLATLWDVQEMIDRQTPWPLINISLKASVDLNDVAALEYVAEIHRDDYQLPEAQVFQGVQLALRYVLF